MGATSKLKSLYPKWFPYPISWLRVFLSILVLGPMGLSLTMVSFWLGTEFLWLGITDIFNAFGVVALLSILALVIVFPIILLTYTYQILTIAFNARSLSPHLPRWIPSPSSWQQGITATLVVGFSSLICILLLCWYRPDLMLGEESWRHAQFDRIAEGMIPIWFVVAAYLHHWDYLVRQTRAKKRRRKVNKIDRVPNRAVSKPKPKRTPKPIDEVDIELNRMRGELGLHQMRQVRNK